MRRRKKKKQNNKIKTPSTSANLAIKKERKTRSESGRQTSQNKGLQRGSHNHLYVQFLLFASWCKVRVPEVYENIKNYLFPQPFRHQILIINNLQFSD